MLVILLVGLGAGTTAYVLATGSAAPTTSSNQDGLINYNGQWLEGAGPLAWETGHNGTFTSFRAGSTIANVSITGFNIVDSSHLTVTLSYQGTGATPAATIVVAGPGLGGSNTVSAGWHLHNDQRSRDRLRKLIVYHDMCTSLGRTSHWSLADRIRLNQTPHTFFSTFGIRKA